MRVEMAEAGVRSGPVWWLSFADNGAQLARIEESLQSLHRKVNALMAQVQVAQEDLDSTANALYALVDKLNSVDLTSLPKGDQKALVDATAAVTEAVNRVTGTAIPDVPAPNPDPEPTETPDPEPAAEG